MSLSQALLVPLFALACGGDTPPAEPPPAPAQTPEAAPAPEASPPPAADDCEAICDRIQNRCHLDTWTVESVPLFCTMRCESGKDGDAEVAAELACIAEAPTCDAVRACIDHSGLEDAYMIIVTGSKDEAKAKGLLQAYKSAGGPAHGDYPMLLDSGTVEGLNPGFWIVVAGTSRSPDSAETLQSRLRELTLEGFDTKGAYVKPVRVEQPEDLDVDAMFPAAWRAIVIWQTSYELSEDWGWFTGDVARVAKQAGIPVVWAGETPEVEVKDGDQVLTTLDLSAYKGEAAGYVFAQQGKEPVFHAHAMPGDVLKQAGFYFGTDLNL